MDEKYNTLGKRIKHLRMQKGLRRETLAQRVGISEEYLKRLEEDCAERDEMLEKFADVLGTTVGYLRRGEDPIRELSLRNLEDYISKNNLSKEDAARLRHDIQEKIEAIRGKDPLTDADFNYFRLTFTQGKQSVAIPCRKCRHPVPIENDGNCPNCGAPWAGADD